MTDEHKHLNPDLIFSYPSLSTLLPLGAFLCKPALCYLVCSISGLNHSVSIHIIAHAFVMQRHWGRCLVGMQAGTSDVMGSWTHLVAQLFPVLCRRCFKVCMFSEVLAFCLFPFLLVWNCPPVSSGPCLAGSFAFQIVPFWVCFEKRQPWVN